jgi:hypothetical protein
LKSNKRESAGGTPGWTYLLAAIVSVVGLVWTILSHFLPQPDNGRPSGPSPGPQISVNGQHNVGIANMNGGTINMEPPSSAPPPAAPQKQN